MAWEVINHDDFDPEFDALPEAVQDKLLEAAVVLSKMGPSLGRPLVETLKGSRHANMKEIILKVDGSAWRFAFAFNPKRQAVILCGGIKESGTEKRFYKKLLKLAENRFDDHL